jgi:hypothetical protein
VSKTGTNDATLPPGDPTRKSAEHNLANTAKLGNLLR